MRRSWGLGLALAVGACAHAPTQPAKTAGSPADLVPSTIALVEEVRGLKARTPIEVRLLDPAEFSKAFGELHEPSAAELDRLRASWVAFGLAPAAFDLRATIRGVLDEQVVGFYSAKSKALYLRQRMPAFGGDSQAMLIRGVLAHEIEHALQDQLLAPLDRDLADDEANLGRSALVEGDAQLVMLATIAKLNGVSMQTALGNMAALTRLGPDTLARISGFSPKLLEAPAILRETLAFPYVSGMSLVGALWQAGGFDLVNRAFAAPPVSASQVLHPSRYARDVRPRPLAEPALPPAWIEKDRGSMGELGTLAELEQCLGRLTAEKNASGLTGDRYVVGQRPDGKLGLVWVSAWRNRKAADAFAVNMIGQEPCWDKDRGDGEGSVGAEVQIQLVASDRSLAPKWTEMVVMRGVPDAEAIPLLAALATGEPGPAPKPHPPFGEGFSLKPIAPAIPETRHGTLSGAIWRDEDLGIAATIPRGWTVRTDLPGVSLAISSADTPDNGVYGYLPAPLTDELAHEVAGGMTGSFEAAVGGGKKLKRESEQKIRRDHLNAIQTRWGMDATDFELQLLLLPICAGRATAMLATFSHASTRADLAHWVDNFTVDSKAGVACPK